jgi:HEXXH motif-containing protein
MTLRQDRSSAGFEPSGERGRSLDLAMRSRLAQSLGYIFDRIGPDLGVRNEDSVRAVEAIRARRQSPQLFGAYYDLVLAVERDEIDEARGFAGEIVERLDTPPPAAWVASIASRPASDEDRYQRLLLPEEIAAFEPNPEDFAAARERIVKAMDLLDRGFPEMAAEIRELLFEVVIASGPTEKDAMTFDGSSSYMLWGAIMLNATGQSSVLDTAQALAHESGHNLLFGHCVNGSLVENDDGEEFAHPLRQDPRPMDGVFHAAYVIARMHQTVERLLESGVLDPEQTVAARNELVLHRRNFADADSVIRSGGRLTPLGAQTIEAARAHLAVPA